MAKIEPYFDKTMVFEMIGYVPHPGQVEPHTHSARFKCIRSGARWGKSLWGAMEAMPYILTPGTRTWIVAPNYSLGEKEWRYIWDALFAGQSFQNSKLPKLIHQTLRKTNNPVQGQLNLAIEWKHDDRLLAGKPSLPSEVIVKSTDNPQSLLGDEVDFMILSEGAGISKDIWDRYLSLRIVSRKGKVVIPSTSSDDSELLDFFYEMGQNKRQQDYKSWEFPSYENPFWAPNIEEEKARLKSELPEEAYEEQVLGKKVHYAGRFYKEFAQDRHVAELEFIPGSPVFRSWDFGYRHPCIGFFQINHRDQIHWLHTYLGSDMDDSDLIYVGKYLSGMFLTKGQWWDIEKRITKEGLSSLFPKEFKPDYYDFCDAYGGIQKRSSEGTAIQLMQKNGIFPRYTFEHTQKNDREPESVQIVRNTLKLRSNGEPNLLIDKENKLAINMFGNLAYEDNSTGIKSYKYKKEGFYEHPHDIYRYFVMHTQRHLLFQKKSNPIREINYR